MLEDREYMRAAGSYGASRWRTATATILIVNVAVYLGQVLLRVVAPRFPLVDYFGLNLAGLVHGFVWQVVTFQFLHGSFVHLLLNSVGLYSFGFAVEQQLGRRRFLVLYLVAGVVGGLAHVLGSLIWPSHFGGLVTPVGTIYVPMVGASAGLFGLVAAFATMFPNWDLRLMFPPVTVRAKVLLWVSLGISVLGILMDTSNVAHGAHAGGILGGWLMLRYYVRTAARRPEEIYATEEPPPAAPREPSSNTDFLTKEVDPILEKISRQGIHSLTAAERRVLEKAREKMGPQ